MPKELYTPKQRMLNAYRGSFSDRYPVAPEFWNYFPAKVLGVSMVEFERELPFWQSLKTVFKRYGTEGWGAVFPKPCNPDTDVKVKLEKISGTGYRETTVIRHESKDFMTTRIFDLEEPSWTEKYMVSEEVELEDCLEMLLSEKNILDFGEINHAYEKVGEDYLLEVWLGLPFFDFVASLMGFEKTILYFLSEDEGKLEFYREKYTIRQEEFIRKVCDNSAYEAFVLGCSFSCNSLLGPELWRKWDKPFIQRLAEEIHRRGKLLHIHFHGRSMETASDFAEIGIDCVCPFERSPGGDVDHLEGLVKLRALLQEKVTMNGNVHTVETLIRGTPEDAVREVRQIKEAFKGSSRLIIGTGDQVGRETLEDNLLAMIEEAKRT